MVTKPCLDLMELAHVLDPLGLGYDNTGIGRAHDRLDFFTLRNLEAPLGCHGFREDESAVYAQPAEECERKHQQPVPALPAQRAFAQHLQADTSKSDKRKT